MKKMKKTIRKFLGYFAFTWLVLVVITAAAVSDCCIIYAYNDFRPRVGWWAMFLFLLVPLNIICFTEGYRLIKDMETIVEMLTED